MGPSREQTFENIDIDGAFADTGREGVLVFEGGAACGNLVQNIEVNASQVTAVFPARTHFALQVQEGNFISGVMPEIWGRKNRDEGQRFLGVATMSPLAVTFGAVGKVTGEEMLAKVVHRCYFMTCRLCIHNDFLTGTWSEETCYQCTNDDRDGSRELSASSAHGQQVSPTSDHDEGLGKACAKRIGYLATDFLDAGQLGQ